MATAAVATEDYEGDCDFDDDFDEDYDSGYFILMKIWFEIKRFTFFRLVHNSNSMIHSIILIEIFHYSILLNSYLQLKIHHV